MVCAGLLKCVRWPERCRMLVLIRSWLLRPLPDRNGWCRPWLPMKRNMVSLFPGGRSSMLFHRQSRSAGDGSHREARLNARHAGEAGQVLVVDAFEIRQVGYHQPQQIVVLSGHEVALHYFGDLADGVLKGFQA